MISTNLDTGQSETVSGLDGYSIDGWEVNLNDMIIDEIWAKDLRDFVNFELSQQDAGLKQSVGLSITDKANVNVCIECDWTDAASLAGTMALYGACAGSGWGTLACTGTAIFAGAAFYSYMNDCGECIATPVIEAVQDATDVIMGQLGGAGVCSGGSCGSINAILHGISDGGGYSLLCIWGYDVYDGTGYRYSTCEEYGLFP